MSLLRGLFARLLLQYNYLLAATLFLLIMGCPLDSYGIVNIETLRTTQSVDNIQADVAVNFSDGNTESLDFFGGLGLRLSSVNAAWLVIGSGELRERRESRFSRKVFGHIRYHLKPANAVSEEFFVQAQYDENLSLSSRVLLGAGLRADIRSLVGGSDSSSVGGWRMFVGSALMYESEKLVGENRGLSIVRLSSYFSIRFVGSNVSFSSISYFQPRVDDFADLRLTSESEFSSKLGSGFKMALSVVAAYDAVPPGVVENWDISSRAGLKYSWPGL